jgi:hypothetical protein
MYQEPMVASGPSADDYLLGKPLQEKPGEMEIKQVRLHFSPEPRITSSA